MPGKFKSIGIVAAAIALVVALFGVTASSRAGAAADQESAQLSFEVASIRPSGEFTRGTPVDRMEVLPGGRWTASAISLGKLIQIAFDVKHFQVSGPTWMNSDRYDITAKADLPSISNEQLRLLLQSLLAERFNLKHRRETKELPIYALVVGKNGHKLQKSEPQPGEGGAQAGNFRRSAEGLAGERISMDALADVLFRLADRPVLDKTGLTDYYDILLPMAIRATPFGAAGGSDRPAASGSMIPADPVGSSIYSDVEKALGLKLDPQKSPVEIIVIDHIEKAVIR